MPTTPDGQPPRLPPHLDPRGPGRGRRPVEPGVGRRPSWRPGPARRRALLVARRGMTVALAVASVLVLLTAGTGYGLLVWSDASIERVDAFAGLGSRPSPSAGGGTTFLLVGSDVRTGMSAADLKRLHVGSLKTAEGRRADTMLLVHVSARHGTATVVSLPRDSYVTIPAHEAADGSRVPERKTKLNAAYAWGGPQLAVATVERTTGVRIDHYMEVDFLGFERLVDAVGGVDVCTPTRLRDRKAGLRLPAGVSHVDGETGLAYVRARHLDARADLGRVERQQQFLGAMVRRVTSSDVLLDPRTLVRFLDAALGAVRVDPGLERAELVELAARLRHISGKDVRFLTVPVADPSYRAGAAGAVALWDDSAADRLFTGLREDRPPPRKAGGKRAAVTVPPSQVRVQVYNGTGVAGLGARAGNALAARGFALTGPAQNWRTGTVRTSLIRYDSRYTESVKTLVAALPGARTEKVAGLGRTLQVVVGTSYAGTRAVKVAAPRPRDAASSATTAADRRCG